MSKIKWRKLPLTGKNILEKVIVGQSPRRKKLYMRLHSGT